MAQRICRECGTIFVTKYRHVTCSLSCRRERNERRRGAAFSRSHRLAIFDRDGWTCGICHEDVNPNVECPSPMSAVVDHIIPISLRGEHSTRNAQCAHWICNSRKGPSNGDLLRRSSLSG
jgi:5-methylcytosine-specific restriction endonuclease McrA